MKTILYIFLLVIITGCSSRDISSKYNRHLVCTDSVKAEMQVLNDTALFRFPLQIACTDSLLIILDEMGDCYFHLYTLEGEPLGHFARRGQGPGELLSADYFHLSDDEDSLYVFASSSRKIVAYHLHSILSDKLAFHEYSIDYALLPRSEVPTILYDMLPFQENRFWIKGNHEQLRYGIYDVGHGKVTPLYTHFPVQYIEGSKEESWSVLSSNTHTRLKPDKTKLVNATYLGGILELFNLDKEGKIVPDTTLLIYEPRFGVAQGAVPAYAVNNETTQFGFEDMCVTDNYIYTLLHEYGDPYEPKDILIFDWEGNPTHRIMTDIRMARLCVDEAQRSIYVIATHEENGYQLVALKY